jgi:L-iditol 2-dehydrogenase
MKQVILREPRKFETLDAPKPICGEKQALIRVRAVGICGSDIHAYYGKHPFISCPIVMGHEASGEIVELGAGASVLAGASGLKIGDRVVLRPQHICGTCYQCKSGHYNICNHLKVLGCQLSGASSEFYAADADLFYKIPDGADFKTGTLIEPLAVGVHAVKRGAPQGAEGKRVLVIGAGTIGNVTAQSARALGAKDVIITDVSEFKLGLAKKCRLENAVNVTKIDLGGYMTEKFGPDGADIIYECTASEAGVNQALDLARKGVSIVIVGVYGSRVNVNMANVQDREYSLVGTLMYLHEDYVDAIRLLGGKKVDLKTLITNEFPFEKSADAYAHIDANRDSVQKVILTV